MMEYGIDDRTNGGPGSECLFVVMDAGEEALDVFDAREPAASYIRRMSIANLTLLTVPRWGRTVERDALAADGSRYTAVLWPDGQPSEVWADDEHDAAEHGFRA